MHGTEEFFGNAGMPQHRAHKDEQWHRHENIIGHRLIGLDNSHAKNPAFSHEEKAEDEAHSSQYKGQGKAGEYAYGQYAKHQDGNHHRAYRYI
ncbi:hypothetical protein ES703_106583 [subsurface metagenome]